MKKHLIVSAICAAIATPTLAQDVTPDTVVATVNGEDITVTHVLDIHRQLPDQYRNLPAETLFEGIIGQLVQQRAMAASVTDEPAWLDEALSNNRAALLAGIVMADIGSTEVSDEAVQDAYDAQFGSFEGAAEFNASHILLETEEEAADIATRAKAGEDFASLAQEFSTGPSGPRGGELGWFGQGMMVPEFETAVMTLDVGQISAPIQTQFGWHVIKLNETRMTEPPALEEVRADLVGQIQSQLLETRMTELVDAAQVERVDGIDPNVLNTLTLSDE